MDGSKSHRRRRGSWAIVVPGLVLAAAGVVWWSSQEPETAGTPAAPSPTEETAEVVPASRLPEAAPAPWTPGTPMQIVIPALQVDVPVDPILAPGGVLTPPSNPQTVG